MVNGALKTGSFPIEGPRARMIPAFPSILLVGCVSKQLIKVIELHIADHSFYGNNVWVGHHFILC